MYAAGYVLAADTSNLVPILSACGGLLLGLSGFAAVLTALGNRRNYVTGSYKDLNEASAKEAEQERQKAADERALRLRAERLRDGWRESYYAVRDEAVAQGVTLMTRPPTEHPSEASP